MTSNPEDWPDKADLLKLEFKKGLKLNSIEIVRALLNFHHS